MSDTVNFKAVVEKATSRRTFMAASGAAGVGLAVAACGSSNSSSGSSSSSSSSSAPSSSSSSGSAAGDTAVAKVAASLEVLAVSTYKAGLDAATAGKLGAVPPAVATFATTAMAHHQAALEKWNGVLTSGGGQAVSTPPMDLNATVQKAFGQVTDIPGLAKLALLLEQTAADTYFTAIPTLKSKDAITLAGSIQIVDQQHQSILLYVLGEYPVPDVFQKGAKAYAPTG